MAYTLNNYKCAGVIFEISEIEYTKKSNWPKRHLYIEVPTASGGMQKTEIFKFLVMGEEAKSLDWYNTGEWVEVLFRIEGRWWKPPDEEKKVHLMSLRPIDIHKGENPFEKDVEEMSQDPDDLSPDIMKDLAKNVRDYTREVANNGLFAPPGDNNEDDLPF